MVCIAVGIFHCVYVVFLQMQESWWLRWNENEFLNNENWNKNPQWQKAKSLMVIIHQDNYEILLLSFYWHERSYDLSMGSLIKPILCVALNQ